MKRAAVRIWRATLGGEMLLEGQRLAFVARVEYPKIDAEFSAKDENGKPVDQLAALRALEMFIEEHLRGGT